MEVRPVPRQVPTRLALALAAHRGRRTWRDPQARAAARAYAELVTGPGPQVDAVARAHLAASAAREEYILRPWANARVAVRGLEHLRAARAGGRGVLVSYCHVGPFPGLGATVARCTPDTTCIVGDWLLGDQPDPARQRRALAWRSMFERQGAPMLAARGSSEEAVRLLRGGAVVALAFDVPGSQPTPFLGRSVLLAGGTARMAVDADALIVPAVRRLVRYRARTAFCEPLDPRDHDGWRSLHDALAGVHSALIREQPAALEDPYRPGWWGHGTTAGA